MGIVKQLAKKASRKSLKSSASVLGLAAGAVGWSGLAQASSEESTSQMMLPPEHYELMDNGEVVFKLETGETLSLTADQYLILQDGLLLITDELAQASMDTLPVLGSVRSELLQDLQPVRSPDGTIVQASNSLPLWSGEGDAPRVFEQLDIERYEIAQTADDDDDATSGNGLSTGWQLAEGSALAGGMLVAAALFSGPNEATEGELEAGSASEPQREFKSYDLSVGSEMGFPLSSSPTYFTAYNGEVYFKAKNGTNGYELWKFDGTSASMVADVFPGETQGVWNVGVEYNGALYFCGVDADNGKELWKYDGTSASLVTDIAPGASSSSTPYNFIVFDNKLYFVADNGTSGKELFAFDGTAVSLVEDINDGGNPYINELVIYNNELYFIADDGENGSELWKTDGTTTTIAAEVAPGSWGSVVGDLTVWDGYIYMEANDNGAQYGRELYRYDGSTISLAYDHDTEDSSDGVSFENMVALEDQLFFKMYTSSAPDGEVFKYDGDTISLVRDINPDSGSHPDEIYAFHGGAYFRANDGDGGDNRELWFYDGETAELLNDIRAGGQSFPKEFFGYNDTLYFQANDGIIGSELWTYG